MIVQAYDELVDEDEMTETDKSAASAVKPKTQSAKAPPQNIVLLANKWLAACAARHTLQDTLKLQEQAPAVIKQLLNHIAELEFQDVPFRSEREQLALEAGQNLLTWIERAASIQRPKQNAELVDRRVK